MADYSNPVLVAMRERYSKGDFSALEVQLTGILRRPAVDWIFRRRDGTYSGNGFGRSGARLVLVEVAEMKLTGGQ
jgi:hypothetical protein